MTTTTEHIKALLVDDGREFAMIRKTDLSALMAIAEKDPFLGRYLDPIGEFRYEAACFARREKILADKVATLSLIARKHGEERRRYMANNKALQARIDALEYASVGMQAHWEEQRRQMFDYIDQIIAGAEREARLESRILRVARFKRKFPSIGRIMDMTP